MKLPAATAIAREKITRYPLVPQARADKLSVSAVRAVNSTLQNADRLLNDLRSQILPLDAIPLENGKFGQYYEIRGTLSGPNGIMRHGADHLDNRALVGHDKVRYAYTRQTEHDMTLELYTDAVLTCHVPEHRLKRGEIVKLVDHHVTLRRWTEGYSIEVYSQWRHYCRDRRPHHRPRTAARRRNPLRALDKRLSNDARPATRLRDRVC